VSRPTPRASSNTASPHYSYAFYADPAMASQFDAARFGGPIGALLAETQARVLTEFARVRPGITVLDVGTGTGRAALTLAAAGARVTGVDASREMLHVARERALLQSHPIVFTPADAHALPFHHGAFDVAVSLRVLMHTPDWRQCISELCRVASGAVIIDYPALASVAVLQSAARRIAALCGARVEAYRVFSDRAIREELARHGFTVRQTHRQFVLPIAFHKRLGSRRLTESVEAGMRSLGLLNLVGSPVTVLAVRCVSS
jgi:2-polyprenyl-3-methyl-5-hydroxy-6-metoxy-1,4-benzoquinol methylase